MYLLCIVTIVETCKKILASFRNFLILFDSIEYRTSYHNKLQEHAITDLWGRKFPSLFILLNSRDTWERYGRKYTSRRRFFFFSGATSYNCSSFSDVIGTQNDAQNRPRLFNRAYWHSRTDGQTEIGSYGSAEPRKQKVMFFYFYNRRFSCSLFSFYINIIMHLIKFLIDNNRVKRR